MMRNSCERFPFIYFLSQFSLKSLKLEPVNEFFRAVLAMYQFSVKCKYFPITSTTKIELKKVLGKL